MNYNLRSASAGDRNNAILPLPLPNAVTQLDVISFWKTNHGDANPFFPTREIFGLDRPEPEEDGSVIFRCIVLNCGFGSKSRPGLASHYRAVHGNNGTQVSCFLCGQMMLNKGVRNLHTFFGHLRTVREKCPGYAENILYEAPPIMDLVAWYDMRDEWKTCILCEKIYKSTDSLSTHIRIQHTTG